MNNIFYKPHALQLKYHLSKARFRTVPTGRQFGKTTMCVNEAVKNVTEDIDGKIDTALGWWVAPYFYQCNIAYDIMTRQFRNIIRSQKMNPMVIEFNNGSKIEFRSVGNKPRSLVGPSINNLFVDECGIIPRIAIYESLLPTLTVTNGRATFMGVPKGKDWFHDMYLLGLDTSQPEFESFHFSTYDNPYANIELINLLKNQMSEKTFRQEYLAEFLDNSNAVFKNVDSIVSENIQLIEGRVGNDTYSIGLDIAKERDWTVITVLNNRLELVYIERFNKDGYPEQIQRIADVSWKFGNAYVYADNNGVGAGVIPFIQRLGVKVVPITFTNASKKAMVDMLSIVIEQKQLSIPSCKDTELLVEELRNFEYVITDTSIKYNAPSNKHDDCVISLALAIWGSSNTPIMYARDVVVQEPKMVKSTYDNAYLNPSLVKAMRGRV